MFNHFEPQKVKFTKRIENTVKDMFFFQEKTYSRQGSSSQLKGGRGRGMDSHSTSGRGQSNAQAGDDAFIALLLQRFSETDDFDGETHSLLMTTLMQFLSQPELAREGDEKEKGCSQMRTLVLKHLNLLLGFCPNDRAFCLTPQRLRASTTFNAFLSALPHFLDHNLTIGATLLPLTLSTLIFCPAPPSQSSPFTWLQCQGQAGIPTQHGNHGSIISAGISSTGLGNK